MKNTIALIILISLLLSSCQNPATISATIPVEQDQNTYGFLQATGQALVNVDSGELFRLRAINFTHPPTAEEYLDVHSMGFNTIRLTLELDQFKGESGFTWLDTQIKYARDAGVYLLPSLKFNQSKLWSDSSNSKSIVNFWHDVAKKYAMEEVIVAYDLLSAPSPMDLNQWQLLAEETAAAIRTVDSNHPLILQAALLPDRTFIYLDDSNYILGFDFFKPFEFTALNKDQYPNEKLFQPAWDNFRLVEVTGNPKLAAGTIDWTETYTSLNPIENREAVIGIPGIACSNLLGSAWFSNFVVHEIDETGQTTKQIQAVDLAQSNFWAPWSGDNSVAIKKVDGGPWGEAGKSFLFVPNREGNPASGTMADPNFAFEIVPGRSYTINGWVRGENVNTDADCSFGIEVYAYGGNDPLIIWDKDHLQREFEKLLQYGKLHNLPMMLVDFGVTRNTLGNGGEVWAQDMFDLLDDSSLSYAWKSYRDVLWGLYSAEGSAAPNAILVELFQPTTAELIASTSIVEEVNSPSPLADGFVHAEGQNLVIGPSNQAFHLFGINFNNDLYTDKFPLAPYHGKRDFLAVKKMGFNVIRFNLTYQWFTDNPERGWSWLDQQITWAKEAGVYLVINMHYVPGQDIWTISYDPEFQKQTAELWRALADRYKNETIIAGYDLLNEPNNVESAVYQAYMQQVVDAIREVDPNHLIIVEAINEYTPRFVTVQDDNVMYDFHFYHPIDLTHENANGSLDTKTYPDESLLELRWDRLKYLGGPRTISIPQCSSDWVYYESSWIDPGLQENAQAFGVPKIICNSNNGRASFGDLQILAAEGTASPITVMAITMNSQIRVEKGQDSGSTVFGLSPENHEGTSDARSLTIRASTSRSWVEFVRNAFEVLPDTSYQIRGWMKGDDISAGTDCYYVIEIFQLDPQDKLIRHDREFLTERLMPAIQFRNQNNVPINVGEFGVFQTTFLSPDAGGARWTADMLDLLIENNINFAYWDYDGSWGLYPDQMHYPDPVNINEALLNVFLDKLH